MFKSLKIRLLLWSFLIFLVFSAGFSIYLYEEQKSTLLSAVDRFLQSKAQVIAGLIEVYEDGKIEFELTERKIGFERVGTLYDILHSGHYFQVFFENGSLLSVSPSLGDYRLPIDIHRVQEEGEYFFNASDPEGEPLRIFTQRITLSTPHLNGEPRIFIVQTAESLADINSFLTYLRRCIIYGIPVTILVFLIGAVIIAKFSLEPLRRFSQRVKEITARNLHQRINEEDVVLELKDLATSFNTTLDSLESVFKQQLRFLSNASHELRTPTAVIKSCCEIYMRKERSVKEYKDALNTILANVNKMEMLVERLLMLSRLEQRNFPTSIQNIPISQLIKKVKDMLSPLAKKKGIKQIYLNLPEKEIYVKGDRLYLSELFMNILDNAIRYNRPEGMINVTVGKKDNEVFARISDTGIGISSQDLPYIFERFYRGQLSSSKNDTKGTGLGLSIAKEIIEIHHGRIEVMSKEKEGSTFTVYLPIKS